MTQTETHIITCTCRVCGGRQARLADAPVTADGKPLSATAVHNIVCLAYSPLAKARSVREHGPWAVR